MATAPPPPPCAGRPAAPALREQAAALHAVAEERQDRLASAAEELRSAHDQLQAMATAKASTVERLEEELGQPGAGVWRR